MKVLQELRYRLTICLLVADYIWTPLVEELAERSEEGVEAFRRELDSRHPIGHIGEPHDIAFGALYLASDESKFVTGSELVIDGSSTAQ